MRRPTDEHIEAIEWQAGHSFTRWYDAPVLEIGADVFTRREIRKLGFPPFSGAYGVLNRALAKFRPGDVTELSERARPADLRKQGVGHRSMIVWLYVLESCGINCRKWLGTDLKLSTLCTMPLPKLRKLKDQPPRKRGMIL